LAKYECSETMLISQSFDGEEFRSGNFPFLLELFLKSEEKFSPCLNKVKHKKAEKNFFNFSLFDDILCNSNNGNKSADIEKQTFNDTLALTY
jgi:hypothetical protein